MRAVTSLVWDGESWSADVARRNRRSAGVACSHLARKSPWSRCSRPKLTAAAASDAVNVGEGGQVPDDLAVLLGDGGMPVRTFDMDGDGVGFAPCPETHRGRDQGEFGVVGL